MRWPHQIARLREYRKASDPCLAEGGLLCCGFRRLNRQGNRRVEAVEKPLITNDAVALPPIGKPLIYSSKELTGRRVRHLRLLANLVGADRPCAAELPVYPVAGGIHQLLR